MSNTNFVDSITLIRKSITTIASELKDMRQKRCETPVTNQDDIAKDFQEVMSNLTLAYRHLEDASMRMDKVLQAHVGDSEAHC